MKTVNRNMLNAWNMLDGAEDIHPIVVDNGRLMKWSGTQWADQGPASDSDKEQYPVVVEG